MSKRSGISLDRSVKLEREARNKIGEIYSMARVCFYTSEKISESTREVYAWLESKHVPQWVIAYVRGYADALRERLYHTHIVWTMSVDGVLYTSEEMRALDAKEKADGTAKREGYRSPWGRCDSEQSRHVWRNDAGVVRKDRSFDAKWYETVTV